MTAKKKAKPKKPWPPKQGWPAYQKSRRAAHRQAGICVFCKDPAAPGHVSCDYHLAYYAQFRRDRRAEGRCADCYRKAAPGYSRCETHRQEAANRPAVKAFIERWVKGTP